MGTDRENRTDMTDLHVDVREGRHQGSLPDSSLVEKENGEGNPQDRYRIDREDAEFIYEHAVFELFLDIQACVVSRGAWSTQVQLNKTI